MNMAQDTNNNVSHREQWRVSERICTRNLKVPVQCEENPEGQNGWVIFENSSYRLFLSDGYVEDREHQTSAHHETLRAPVQCEEIPGGQNGYVIADSGSYRLSHGHQSTEHHDPQQNATSLGVPVQCEENPEGQNGCVIFENSSYRLFLSDSYVEDREHQTSAHHETLRDHHMLHGLFEMDNLYAIAMQLLVEEDSGNEQMHVDVDFWHDK